jgi:hypothetical protein
MLFMYASHCEKKDASWSVDDRGVSRSLEVTSMSP